MGVRLLKDLFRQKAFVVKGWLPAMELSVLISMLSILGFPGQTGTPVSLLGLSFEVIASAFSRGRPKSIILSSNFLLSPEVQELAAWQFSNSSLGVFFQLQAACHKTG